MDGCIGYVSKREISKFVSFDKYRQYVEALPLTTNFKHFVGHGALRIAAMGFEERRAKTSELRIMKNLLRESMEHGAIGMSSGLIYPPGCYSDEEELVELCKIVAEYGGIYATHMANEAAFVVQSVNDAISVARRSGVSLNISHHKICGKENWGKSKETLALIDTAREEGMDIFCDIYPYTASMTNLTVCLPSSCFNQGMEHMVELLKDPAERKKVAWEMERIDGRYRHCGGFEGILISSSPYAPEAEGLTMAEYACRIGKSGFDSYFDLIVANGSSAIAIYFSMCEEDLLRIVSRDYTIIGSDGIIRDMSEKTHPRSFGTFPRAIRLFVKEKRLMTLENLIRKMTSLPAHLFGLKNKGVIVDAADADLVIFNYDRIADRADYTHSAALSDGIEYVIVGGQIVYQNKMLTGKFPGCFIAHNAHEKN